jgi:AAA domain-containing protein/DnaB helicase-like protein
MIAPAVKGSTNTEASLPRCPEAESALLGWILLDGARVREILEIISSNDFFPGPNRTIFAAIEKLAVEGTAVDLVSVFDAIRNDPEVQNFGGAGYVSKLPEGIHQKAPFVHYADMVRRAACLRSTIRHCDQIIEATLANDASVETVQARVRDLFFSPYWQTRHRLRAVSEIEMLHLELQPREMILDPIIAAQSLSMIHSPRGIGKTFMGLSIGHAIASGGTFLHWRAPKPRTVLYIDGEMPATVLREKLASIIAGSEQPAYANGELLKLITPDLQDEPMPDLATDAGQGLVEPYLDGVEVVILDNLSCLARSGRENEGEGWLPMQTWALRNRQRGISTVFLHHSGKSGSQRGTSRREDMLDLVVHLKRPADYTPTEGLRAEVHFEKCRALLGDDVSPFEVRLESSSTGAAIWTVRELRNVLTARANELFEAGHTVREVAATLCISKSKAHRLKQQGVTGAQ